MDTTPNRYTAHKVRKSPNIIETTKQNTYKIAKCVFYFLYTYYTQSQHPQIHNNHFTIKYVFGRDKFTVHLSIDIYAARPYCPPCTTKPHTAFSVSISYICTTIPLKDTETGRMMDHHFSKVSRNGHKLGKHSTNFSDCALNTPTRRTFRSIRFRTYMYIGTFHSRFVFICVCIEKTVTPPLPTRKTVLNGYRQIPIHTQAQTQPTTTRSTFHPFQSQSRYILFAYGSAADSLCSACTRALSLDTVFCCCCNENNHPQSALKSFSLENWIRTLNCLIYWKLLFVFCFYFY